MSFKCKAILNNQTIPSSWKVVTIDSVAMVNSKTIGSKAPYKEIAYIDIESVNKGKINTPSIMDFSSAPSRARRKVSPGDILISTVRPNLQHYAYLNETKENWIASTGFAVVSPTQKVDSRFLFYYLTSDTFTNYLTSVADGAAYPAFNPSEIEKAELLLPPLPEQQAIASILSALDDKIELNRRMNQTLESMARALFQSWFVDFDPVRAKMEGRPPYGLDPATAALFHASFEVSPIGEIPQGWKVKPLDQIADFLNGLALQKFPPVGEDYLPVIKIAELRRGITESSDKASTQLDKKYIVEDGDILFSWSGSLEVVVWCGGKGALNQHLFKVTSKDYPKWFYYQWLKEFLPHFQQIAAGKATTMGHIQRHHLTAALAIVPPGEVLKRMTHQMEPILEKIVVNNLEVRTLTTLRDELLPRLMSGELRVKEAERELVEAGI